MNISRAVARVYAQALLDLAVEQDCLGRVVDDLHAVQRLFDDDATFRSFWSTHRIERSAKQRILKESLGGAVDRPVLGLLNILVGKQRELVLDNIVDEFDRYKDIREGRQHAHVVTALALGDDQKAELVSRLKAASGANEIILHERVDPRVLGGVRVKLGDRIIDGTARARLDKLKRTLVADGA